MNKQNNSNGQQIHNFVLFTANYPHLFIEHCWKGKGSLMTHLRDKFHSSKSFIDFWFMLDSANRDILADYISEWTRMGTKHDDYDASVNLSWNEIKDCLGSRYQKEFYYNLCKDSFKDYIESIAPKNI
jgi:hypothetical protein